jgi:hypothetical protein
MSRLRIWLATRKCASPGFKIATDGEIGFELSERDLYASAAAS